MERKTKENIEGVVKLMKDKEVQRKVEEINTEDPLFSLKDTIYSFFKDRLNLISKETSVKEIVKNKIEEKIENDEITIAQLIQLYKDITYMENNSISTLLDVFKPTKEGAVSPLASEVSSGGIANKVPSEITPEDSEALNMLVAMVKNAASLEKDKSDKS
jgi:hypothetical protein